MPHQGTKKISFNQNEEKPRFADDISNMPLQEFCNARNRVLCSDTKGKIMKCRTCDDKFSTNDIVKNASSYWRNRTIHDGSTVANVSYPFSPKRLDLWAINYSYDMDDGCLKDKNADPFFSNRPIRDTLMLHVFDAHDFGHHPSCFKKDPECRHHRPEVAVEETKIYFCEIPGKVQTMSWNRLVECDELVQPVWSVQTKQPMGCQYLNTYNKPVSEVFCCNTNIQIGDRSQVYYCTLYCGKLTQKDDAERENRLNMACAKRILCIQEEVLKGNRRKDEIPEGFRKGFCEC